MHDFLANFLNEFSTRENHELQALVRASSFGFRLSLEPSAFLPAFTWPQSPSVGAELAQGVPAAPLCSVLD